MSKYGIIGHDVTISIVITKTIAVGYADENEAIEVALQEFTITDKDWSINDLEIEDVQPDFFDN